MKKYTNPDICIRELLFEDVVTTSGVQTLKNGGENGSVGEATTSGEAAILDAIMFE